MCILCVIQKWSRRVATMLPWLVIPLIGLWALSQLFPPAFRFEITSPRLACVFVLLVTLFWYEVLMPQLSSWRVRRSATLKEKKRSEAIEMQKLRKTATKKCRNCLSPYRDQNPGGGRFMCSYCGHNSKRPILDLSVPPGMEISNTGILKDLVGKGGKILSGTVWSENSWMCGQDWAENGNWVGGSFVGKSTHWQKSGTGLFGGDVEHCTLTLACKLLTSFFFGIRWLWRKIFRISSPGEDDMSDAEPVDMLAKRGENGTEFHESKSDKARRKAEEKRQARLEKVLLEEEERNQREEVSRLVEERRRLRDEKIEAETEPDRVVGLGSVREKETMKKAEKKRQERRKDKDKGSSKSNSDVEELEKKSGKENDKKTRESVTAHSTDLGNGLRNVTANNYNRVNAGTRYLESMKGKFLSSSKAFGGGSFFGRGTHTPITVQKENRSSWVVEQTLSSVNKRELHQPERVVGKVSIDADDRPPCCPVPSDPHPTPKKSWQHLFTRSPTLPPSSTSNVICRPSNNFHTETQITQLSSPAFDNHINFGLPSPFTPSIFSDGSTYSSSAFPSLNDLTFPRLGETTPLESLPDDSELFEDPCYVPDPVYLLGPVSESLDNFQLDLGARFVRDLGLEKPQSLKNVVTSEISRPSPIESPLSRLRNGDHKYTGSYQFFSSSAPKTQDIPMPLGDSTSPYEKGTYHMWNSSPLGQDGLGLVDFLHPPHIKDGGTFVSPIGIATEHDSWSERSFYPPSSVSESHIAFKPQQEIPWKEMMFESPSKSPTNPVELPQANCWFKNGSPAKISREEGFGSSATVKTHIEGLYSTSDAQSLWSFD